MAAFWGNLVGELRGPSIENSYFLSNGNYGVGKIGNIFVDDPNEDLGIKMDKSQMQDPAFASQLNADAFAYNQGGYPM